MSHFTEMKTNLNDLTRVIRAAKKLDLEVVEALGQPLFAKGFMENEVACDAILKTGTRYDIGVVKNSEGFLELVGDWDLIEKVSELRKEDLVKKLKQQYALTTIEDMAKTKGMSLSTPTIAEDGSIEVTVSSW